MPRILPWILAWILARILPQFLPRISAPWLWPRPRSLGLPAWVLTLLLVRRRGTAIIPKTLAIILVCRPWAPVATLIIAAGFRRELFFEQLAHTHRQNALKAWPLGQRGLARSGRRLRAIGLPSPCRSLDFCSRCHRATTYCIGLRRHGRRRLAHRLQSLAQHRPGQSQPLGQLLY